MPGFRPRFARTSTAARPLAGDDVSAPSVGEPARPFNLTDLEGRRLRLEDLRGRAFLLVFLRHAG